MTPFEVYYTNYKGENALRQIAIVSEPYRGSTEWHPEEQWLIPVVDLDRGVERTFAIRDMLVLNPASLPMAEVTVSLKADSVSRSSFHLGGRNGNGVFMRLPLDAERVAGPSEQYARFKVTGRMSFIAGNVYLDVPGGDLWRVPDYAVLQFLPDSEGTIIKRSHIGRLTAAGVEHIDLTPPAPPREVPEPKLPASIIGRMLRRIGFVALIAITGYYISASPIGGIATAHFKPIVEANQ